MSHLGLLPPRPCSQRRAPNYPRSLALEIVVAGTLLVSTAGAVGCGAAHGGARPAGTVSQVGVPPGGTMQSPPGTPPGSPPGQPTAQPEPQPPGGMAAPYGAGAP